jgi:polyphosphate kinase
VKASRKKKRRKDPELFINRELSWLAFNSRVLEEAVDPDNPLLERLKFATIVASNLDEFFIVRVARLKHAVAEGDMSSGFSGLTPRQQLERISVRVHDMVERLYKTLMEGILPALAERGIRIQPMADLEPEAKAALSRHFYKELLPTLTPLASDASRPFPMLSGLSLNLALLLAPAPEGDEPRLAVVQVPGGLPRLMRVPGSDGAYTLLEDVIRHELPALFPGQEVLESAAFRVARDSELDLDDEGGRDFIDVVEEELRKRRRSGVVRLEVDAGVGKTLLRTLVERLGVAGKDIYRIPGPLDIRALWPLIDLPALEDLRDEPLKPVAVLDALEREEIFSVLEERDVLLHHPYDSFEPVVALVAEAAEDPDVLAIKQTLYRTSGDSPVVQALARAAEAGKQVTVLMELTARFDEESNIRWARSLEEAGAHVIYGIRGYKTHSKICLVVRRGAQGIQRFVHLGTGNYNERTARLYTDFGLMTCDPEIGEDASAFFNSLTGYSDPLKMKKLVMAPTRLRERLLKLIDRERQRAEEGQAALIRGKMNALVDEQIIRALYAASQAGVQVQLNVRGICCLRPGIKGVSENVDVVSIVDRFLEHTRIYHFRNGGDEEVYLSSADWMTRNLDKRIELLFPVQHPDCRRKVLAALDSVFRDNVKARRLQADGTYQRVQAKRGEAPHRAQLYLYTEAQRAVARARAGADLVLEPLTSPRRGKGL